MTPDDVLKECTALSNQIEQGKIANDTAKLQIALLRESTRAMIIRLAEAKHLGKKIYK